MSKKIEKLDTYERIRSKMSESDFNIFVSTYESLEKISQEAIEKLSEHLSDSKNIESFVRTVNESLGRS